MTIETARARFPALERRVAGRPAVYLDGPGGTQVPDTVIEAMASVLRVGISNHGGTFVTSRLAAEVTERARSAVADLLGADGPGEISFGQNMTSITFAMSRALARTWGPGDEIVVTRLDHDANVWPWVIAAGDAGATVRHADFDPEDGCRLRPEHVEAVLTDRTRLVAVTHASNAVGTIVDVAAVTRRAHDAGALVYVDAVHVSPHASIDVRAIGCDFLTASAYKFFGPHTGVLWGRPDLMESIDAIKIRPAPDGPPDKWETGTQSFESLAGVAAAVDYLAELTDSAGTRRARLVAALGAIREYEASLSERFLQGVEAIAGVTVHGVAGPRGRTPTFALAIEGIHPEEASDRLGEQGIFTWAGHYYAIEPMRRLGLLDSGGLLRIGFVHTTTPGEVDLILAAIERLAAGRSLEDLRAAADR